MVIDGTNFSLYQPDIFEQLSLGGDDAEGMPIPAKTWYHTALTAACAAVARTYDCTVAISTTRLEESRVHWMHDIGRIPLAGGGQNPDHFKLAGYLCFWLRRRVVIEEPARMEGTRLSNRQTRFVRFSNELCAFLIGLKICLYFENREIIGSDENGGVTFDKVHLPDDLERDLCELLRSNNVSPHALYLIYKALLTDIGKAGRGGHLRLVT